MGQKDEDYLLSNYKINKLAQKATIEHVKCSLKIKNSYKSYLSYQGSIPVYH